MIKVIHAMTNDGVRLFCQTLTCDVCEQSIKHIEQAVMIWEKHDFEEGKKVDAYVAHKGRCHNQVNWMLGEHVRTQEGLEKAKPLPFSELRKTPFYLMANSGIDQINEMQLELDQFARQHD